MESGRQPAPAQGHQYRDLHVSSFFTSKDRLLFSFPSNFAGCCRSLRNTLPFAAVPPNPPQHHRGFAQHHAHRNSSTSISSHWGFRWRRVPARRLSSKTIEFRLRNVNVTFYAVQPYPTISQLDHLGELNRKLLTGLELHRKRMTANESNSLGQHLIEKLHQNLLLAPPKNRIQTP